MLYIRNTFLSVHLLINQSFDNNLKNIFSICYDIVYSVNSKKN